MRVVGLTGGIGTGKSTVSKMLRELGATVIDADEATRAVQAPGSPGLRRLVDEFGNGIITPEGELDRAALADIVFQDPAARERLNGIVHPLVRQWMAERQQEAAERDDPVVVMDIPLLFESRGAGAFETVIVVYAPEEVAVRRLVAKRGIREDQARARIAAQMPIEEKRRLASHVIDNTGSLAELRREVERAWADLVPAHEPGQGSPRPEPPLSGGGGGP
jgi:dephospho-CoA kinase